MSFVCKAAVASTGGRTLPVIMWTSHFSTESLLALPLLTLFTAGFPRSHNVVSAVVLLSGRAPMNALQGTLFCSGSGEAGRPRLPLPSNAMLAWPVLLGPTVLVSYLPTISGKHCGDPQVPFAGLNWLSMASSHKDPRRNAESVARCLATPEAHHLFPCFQLPLPVGLCRNCGNSLLLQWLLAHPQELRFIEREAPPASFDGCHVPCFCNPSDVGQDFLPPLFLNDGPFVAISCQGDCVGRVGASSKLGGPARVVCKARLTPGSGSVVRGCAYLRLVALLDLQR